MPNIWLLTAFMRYQFCYILSVSNLLFYKRWGLMSLVDYDRCRGVKVNCKKRRASSFLTPHSSWLSHQIILEQCVSGWLLSWGTEQLLAAMPLLCINKTSVSSVRAAASLKRSGQNELKNILISSLRVNLEFQLKSTK